MQGRVVIVGLGAGAEVALVLRQLMSRRASIRGTMLRARPLEEKAQAVRAFERESVPHLASGRIKPVIDSVIPFERDGRGVRAAGRRAASAARCSCTSRERPAPPPDAPADAARGPRAGPASLLTRSHARRFDTLAPEWDTIRSDVEDSRGCSSTHSTGSGSRSRRACSTWAPARGRRRPSSPSGIRRRRSTRSTLPRR